MHACISSSYIRSRIAAIDCLTSAASLSLSLHTLCTVLKCVYALFFFDEKYIVLFLTVYNNQIDRVMYVCVSEAQLCLCRNALGTFSGCVARLLCSFMHKMCVFCKDSHTSIKYYPSRNQNGFETACFMDMMYTIVIRCWSLNE